MNRRGGQPAFGSKAIGFTEIERAILANFILSLAIMVGVGFVIGKMIFGA